MISVHQIPDLKIRDKMVELLTSKVVNCSIDVNGQVVGDPFVTYEEIAEKCFETTISHNDLFIINILIAATSRNLMKKNANYPYIACLAKGKDTGKVGLNFFNCACKVRVFTKSANFTEDSKEATDFLDANVIDCVKYFGKA